jgi:hypothetical protein
MHNRKGGDVLRTHLWAALAVCGLLLVPLAHGDYLDDFMEETQQAIDSGNVQEAGSGYSSVVPQQLQFPAVWGYTYWEDGDTAACTWVWAVSEDGTSHAWTHTTWSCCAPYHNYVYQFNQSSPQPIAAGHHYYVRALHWLPNIREFPPADQEGPEPPLEAQGTITSFVNYTDYWDGTNKVQADLCLNYLPEYW